MVNLGQAFPDGWARLAREAPYASCAWGKRYGRSNLSESRNGSREAMALKRLPNFRLSRNRKEVAIGDFLINLCTLGWLAQEATILALKASAG